MKTAIPRHIIVILLKAKDKILKAAKKNDTLHVGEQ